MQVPWSSTVHLTYILVIFNLKNCGVWFPPSTWAGVSCWHTNCQCLQNLQTARRAHCSQEVGCWWNKVMDAEAAWMGQHSFRIWKGGAPESKLKCFSSIKVCLIPNSSERFLRFGVCGGTVGHGWFDLIKGVLCPGEKSGTFLWRFLDSFKSLLERTVLRND